MWVPRWLFYRSVWLSALALPLSIFVASLLDDGTREGIRTAFSRALLLGGIGVALFVLAVVLAAAPSFRKRDESDYPRQEFDERFLAWGLGALALFIAIWLVMATVILRQEREVHSPVEITGSTGACFFLRPLDEITPPQLPAGAPAFHLKHRKN